jgi:hypothetical protein
MFQISPHVIVMCKFCLAVVQSDGQLPGVAAPAPQVLNSNSVIVISDSEEEEKENRTAGTSRPGRITSVTLMLVQRTYSSQKGLYGSCQK